MKGYFVIIPVTDKIEEPSSSIFKNEICFVDKNFNCFINNIQHYVYFVEDTGEIPPKNSFVIIGKTKKVNFYTNKSEIKTEDWMRNNTFSRVYFSSKLTRKICITNDRRIIGVSNFNFTLFLNFEKLFHKFSEHTMTTTLFEINDNDNEIKMITK